MGVAELASRAIADGDVCLTLADAAVNATGTRGAENGAPLLESLCSALRRWEVVGEPGDAAPLVLDFSDRLYLGRYSSYERTVAHTITRLASGWVDDVDYDQLRVGLDRCLGATDSRRAVPDCQRVAAIVAVCKRLCIISGGPGTGKTYTVAAIVRLLQEQASSRGVALRVQLAAPTGKAAARLTESIRGSGLFCRSLGDGAEPPAHQVSDQGVTLHRLLGFRAGRSRPKYHRGNPLHVDVVVVDEASMVDLPLMARLLDALPPHARLILLGDRDQLASVEAGAVLGDLCGGGREVVWSAELAARVAELGGVVSNRGSSRQLDLFETLRSDRGSLRTFGAGEAPPALADCVVVLRESRRFKGDSGIGALAAAVNNGDVRGARIVSDSGRSDVTRLDLDQSGLVQLLRARLVPWYRACLRSGAPADILSGLSGMRILCAVRDGPFGVVAVNRLAEQVLADAGVINRSRSEGERGRQYSGRPILILGNDYTTGLYNGDVGVLLPDITIGGTAVDMVPLRAWFDGDDGPRCIIPSRLPAHETCFAMTVHKSQGSEVDEVILVIPPYPTHALTRELLYTGITRARERVTLICSPARLADAVATRTERRSGLSELLWSSGASSHLEPCRT